jgi:hypothetical protein
MAIDDAANCPNRNFSSRFFYRKKRWLYQEGARN